MGTNPSDVFASGITAGWTRASPLTFGTEDEMIKNGLRFGDMIGRPHDVFKLIFWNESQRQLLDGNHQFVLFCLDYGAGKLYTLNWLISKIIRSIICNWPDYISKDNSLN